MPTITAGIAGDTTVAGLDATAAHVFEADLVDDVLVYGLPATLFVPAPTPQTTPDAAQARVLDESGNFICQLPHAQGLRWLDEHNTAGSGSIDVRRYDDVETDHPNVWDAGNQIMISVGGRDIFRLVLDSEAGYRVEPATGARIDTRQGAGQLGVLNSGMCIPEYGWRAEATEERTFDYGSNPSIGGWYVASEWKTAVGKLVRKSWRWVFKKRHRPKGWRDRKAEWLWWKNPDATQSVNETCYFAGSFHMASPGRARIQVAGDDTLEFQLDGEVRATTGPGGWKRATKIVMHLSAGDHYVAGKVTNTAGSGGNQNRSGFICSIARINGDGDVVKWLLRSKPSTFKVRRQRSAPPGWFAAQILRQLVQEQKDRGCAGHSSVTFGFTTTADSSGVAWQGRQEISIPVGTLALDYIQQLVETGMDVAMTPSLVLNAWRTRGADRSGWVRLDQGDARPLEESAAQPPAIRNAAYAKAATGWVGRVDQGSIDARGRRETMIALGGSQSPQQTDATIASMLPDLADPPQTYEVKLSGATGNWQPYRDFDVADWVSFKATGWTTWRRVRVMSIGGEVNPAGHPDWTVQLYEG